jgi:hypothetical protein
MAKTLLIRAECPSLDPTLDGFSNGFVWHSDTATDLTDLSLMFTAIEHFYNTVPTGGVSALTHYMAASLDRTSNHASITAYDITTHLDGSPAGAPVGFANWTLAAGGGASPVPEGVAAAISFRADYGSDVEFGPGDRPRARDRNRIYLGPLDGVCLRFDATSNRCEFIPQFITDCLKATAVLAVGIDLSGTPWYWRQWSRRNAAIKVPLESWMDNRPDYQRRRSDDNPASRTYQALS